MWLENNFEVCAMHLTPSLRKIRPSLQTSQTPSPWPTLTCQVKCNSRKNTFLILGFKETHPLKEDITVHMSPSRSTRTVCWHANPRHKIGQVECTTKSGWNSQELEEGGRKGKIFHYENCYVHGFQATCAQPPHWSPLPSTWKELQRRHPARQGVTTDSILLPPLIVTWREMSRSRVLPSGVQGPDVERTHLRAHRLLLTKSVAAFAGW